MTVTVFGYLILLLGKHRFLRFYFSVFSLVLVSIEKIFQTLIKHSLSCLIYYLEKCNSSEGPFLMQVFEVPYTRQV